jgi:hypothetical protein
MLFTIMQCSFQQCIDSQAADSVGQTSQVAAPVSVISQVQDGFGPIPGNAWYTDGSSRDILSV